MVGTVANCKQRPHRGGCFPASSQWVTLCYPEGPWRPSLALQWLRLPASNAGGPALISDQGARSTCRNEEFACHSQKERERERGRKKGRKGGREEGRKKRSCMLQLRGPHAQQLGLGAAKYLYELKKQKDHGTGVMRASDFSRKTRN